MLNWFGDRQIGDDWLEQLGLVDDDDDVDDWKLAEARAALRDDDEADRESGEGADEDTVDMDAEDTGDDDVDWNEYCKVLNEFEFIILL